MLLTKFILPLLVSLTAAMHQGPNPNPNSRPRGQRRPRTRRVTVQTSDEPNSLSRGPHSPSPSSAFHSKRSVRVEDAAGTSSSKMPVFADAIPSSMPSQAGLSKDVQHESISQLEERISLIKDKIVIEPNFSRGDIFSTLDRGKNLFLHAAAVLATELRYHVNDAAASSIGGLLFHIYRMYDGILLTFPPGVTEHGSNELVYYCSSILSTLQKALTVYPYLDEENRKVLHNLLGSFFRDLTPSLAFPISKHAVVIQVQLVDFLQRNPLKNVVFKHYTFVEESQPFSEAPDALRLRITKALDQACDRLRETVASTSLDVFEKLNVPAKRIFGDLLSTRTSFWADLCHFIGNKQARFYPVESLEALLNSALVLLQLLPFLSERPSERFVKFGHSLSLCKTSDNMCVYSTYGFKQRFLMDFGYDIASWFYQGPANAAVGVEGAADIGNDLFPSLQSSVNFIDDVSNLKAHQASPLTTNSGNKRAGILPSFASLPFSRPELEVVELNKAQDVAPLEASHSVQALPSGPALTSEPTVAPPTIHNPLPVVGMKDATVSLESINAKIAVLQEIYNITDRMVTYYKSSLNGDHARLLYGETLVKSIGFLGRLVARIEQFSDQLSIDFLKNLGALLQRAERANLFTVFCSPGFIEHLRKICGEKFVVYFKDLF